MSAYRYTSNNKLYTLNTCILLYQLYINDVLKKKEILS